MSCPSPEQLLLYVQGGAGDELEAHFGECAACRNAVLLLLRTSLAQASPGAETGPASTPPPARSPDLPRGTTLGRYLILERIGQGGMGVVYAAFDPELDRRIALKLIRTDLRSGHPDALRARLLREAQAMARLGHPNVVQVYDVGVLGDQVFLAMEWVNGGTIREWLRAERPWREVLAMFVAAGRGLAAAHQAGLVHRDFKPDNVLVDKEGRPRVTDFGLARPVGALVDDAPASPDSPLHADLTATGVVLGTPGYMAPEQLRGQATDARADLFSFCVALFEALYAQKPFSGESRDAMLAAIDRGVVPASQSTVPRELQRVLTAGLHADREARTPTMEALLDALTRAARPSRRWQWASLALALLALGAGGWRYTVARAQRCSAMPARLSGVWDGARKQQVHAAFLATKVSYAENAWRSVEKALDDYTGRWSKMAVEACVATRIRGSQSELLYERREECLERRLHELSAQNDLFSHADANLVQGSVEAVGRLSAIEPCADTTALLDAVEPASQADYATVRRFRDDLNRLKVLDDVGRDQEVAKSLPLLVERAQRLADPQLESDVYYYTAMLRFRGGHPKDSELSLHASALAALRAHDEYSLSRAWLALSQNVGTQQGRGEDGLRWVDYSEAAGLRQEDYLQDADERAATRAFILAQLGHTDEALRQCHLALDAKHASFTKSVESRGNVLAALSMLGRFDEAQALGRDLLKDIESAYGPDHPNAIKTRVNLAATLLDARRYPEALPLAQEALEAKKQELGGITFSALIAVMNLGEVEQGVGKLAQARDHLRAALALLDDHHLGGPNLVEALGHLGEVERRLGDPAAAATLERALTTGDHFPPVMTAPARFSLAQLTKDRTRARTLATAARDAWAADKTSPFAAQDRDAAEAFLAAH